MNYIILIIGFFLLIKGADLFVDGASNIAKKMGIPSVIVGLTIVSLGTSAPELAVSISAALKGNNEITMGNVLGSNLFNILAVLGCMALASPVFIEKKLIKKDLLVNLGASVLLYFLVFSKLGFLGESNLLAKSEGLLLVLICIAYISYLVYSVKRANTGQVVDEVASGSAVVENEPKEESKLSIPKSIILVIIGVIGIVFGGDLVVDSASNIAMTFGLSEKLVGLTIVAIGTSLPELVTSLVAAKKGENDIALGNILGSNTFNILLILGLSSSISAMTISATLVFDLLFLIIVTLLVAMLVFMNKKEVKKVNRYEGMILLGLYITYTVLIIMRN